MLLAAADTVPAAAGILPKPFNICLSKTVVFVVFVAVVPAAAILVSFLFFFCPRRRLRLHH